MCTFKASVWNISFISTDGNGFHIVNIVYSLCLSVQPDVIPCVTSKSTLKIVSGVVLISYL